MVLSILLPNKRTSTFNQYPNASMNHFQVGMSLHDALTLPNFAHSFEKNKTAFNVAMNTDQGYFEWLFSTMDPRNRQIFAKAMRGAGSLVSKSIAESYPWGSLGENAVIVDVGGGAGHILMPVVKEFPHLKLVVEDLESQIALGNKVCRSIEFVHVDLGGRSSGGDSGKSSVFDRSRLFYPQSHQRRIDILH